MKKVFLALVFLLSVIATSACGSAPRTSSQPPKEESAPREALPQNREAIFREVENDIRMRPISEGEMMAAEVGQSIYSGGSVKSGDDSRARLDLLPEKTIMRVAPNSSFTLDALNNDPHSPFTRLELFLGEIWIVLSGGELDVGTSYGTASVRGSMMSVSFDPDGTGMLVTCLEGHCSLESDTERVEFGAGFASAISEEDQAPSEPRPMSEEEYEEWEQIFPDVEALLEEIEPDKDSKGEENTGASSGQSITYNLNNNCEDIGWTWVFEGATTITVSLAPGERASGTLPPGDYMVTDTLEGEGSNGPNHVPGGTRINFSSCP